MNPVLILSRNNLDLTKRCVESVRAQDVPTEVYLWDNGSTDGTVEWIAENIPSDHRWTMYENCGVTHAWNSLIGHMFIRDYPFACVVNNDAILPKGFLRELGATALIYGCEFITGVAVDYMPTEVAPFQPPSPHPDFSAFMLSRAVWEKIGPFDERMKIYCSDCDYHIRGHRLGVPMYKANVPYFHLNSQTMKRAEPADRAAIQAQANADREVFKSIYGCLPGTPEYENLFK